MSTAQTIREAVAEVQRLREECREWPGIGQAVVRLKRFQAARFAGTYADLLASGTYGAAARFFLEELYGDRDYADRDTQFARIAGAVEKLFPRDVAQTAGALAQLHALTESLDHGMARAIPLADAEDVAAYVRAWKAVGRRADRQRQLESVVGLGAEMTRLTRLPGLRTMLKMMRRPAAAAGLSSLQSFLESGFDTFAAVARQQGGAERFLETVREREQRLMDMLFDDEAVACETELRRILGQAR
ncbi:hypothetical protein H8N03_13480 [Ramlibacter sp. USB13]|uniref:DUF8198 domain-containing protein n=1 Tax=Ramlibacter cellulosilyticus TaxID=2764187 RepID=A0A923MQI4_9BURK|nr:hypothetical protein [Ramlibacter cellulosilyticus]MBC5783962.1 hypothetical protein [Ramlibacter cellulosilyticus]